MGGSLAGAAASKKVTEVSNGTTTLRRVGLLGVVPDMLSYKTVWGFCLSK